MILYLTFIAFCGIVIALGNALGWGDHVGWTFLITYGAILLEMVINGATAGICRSLPKKWVPYEAKFFHVGKREKNFYEKLQIRKWKEKVPEIGQFTGFRKNKVVDPKSVEYIERFLLECRYGEVGHIVSCFSSFLVMLLCLIPAVRWTVVLPIAIIGALMNMPSYMILRYNSYKLDVLYQANKKRAAREKRLPTPNSAE